MKSKKKAIAAVCTTLLLLTATAIGVFLLCFKVESRFVTKTIELGDTLSVSPDSYITGQDWSVNLAKVDASGVDLNRTGEYKVLVDHAWDHFEYLIIIEDTTPPELEVLKEEICLAVDESYPADTFVESVSDNGTVNKLTVDDKRNITFSAPGEYEIMVRAEDESGNSSVKRLWVLADTPPVITGMKPIYISLNTEFDPEVGVTANDDVDGDVTDKIIVDTSNVVFDAPGEYEITYEATDSYNLTGKATDTVYVCAPLELQEKINRHLINEENSHIYGAINIYDAGYYDEDDMGFILEAMEPCVVHFYFRFSNGYAEGSGFIIEITDDAVILCTNAHVAKEIEGRNPECVFYDGTTTKVYKASEYDSSNDVAFLKVMRSDLGESFVKSLKTVHINNTYWNELPQNPDLTLGFRVIRENGSVLADKMGGMVQKEGYCDIEEARNWLMTEVTCENFRGSSGSAVFDSHGNLVAMVRAQSIIGGRKQYWCTTFKQIMDWYRAQFGRDVYYY
ncbi:MAG: DUF5011 domain-containing protein [Lachnospiraceae bacterium]|nr:DUF5011 domain-containing protein [Lachnospiraceae bacterium]